MQSKDKEVVFKLSQMSLYLQEYKKTSEDNTIENSKAIRDVTHELINKIEDICILSNKQITSSVIKITYIINNVCKVLINNNKVAVEIEDSKEESKNSINKIKINTVKDLSKYLTIQVSAIKPSLNIINSDLSLQDKKINEIKIDNELKLKLLNENIKAIWDTLAIGMCQK